MSHYVYRFVNKANTVIYVGKTSQPLPQRFNLHEHLPTACYEQVEHIEYIECQSAAETQIKEVYYINLFKGNEPYFNVLDLAEPIQGVMLTDAWTLYEGPLAPAFSNSWNRRAGLKSSGPGTVGSCSADFLTADQVELMIEKYLLILEQAWSPTLKKVALRDLLIFTLGINSPLRPKELVALQYRDLYSLNDDAKRLEYQLTRGEKDLVLEIELPHFVQDIICLYREVAGLSYAHNATDPIFKSRQKDTPITINALCRRVREPAASIGLDSKIMSNTLRKTYLMNIFNSMDDKVEALLLLDRLNGGSRLATIANYLGLEQAEHGFEIICEGRYPCGLIGIERIKKALEHLGDSPEGIHAPRQRKTAKSKHESLGNDDIPETYHEVRRNGVLSYHDKNGLQISNERILEIKNYVSSNPHFLYSELESRYQIPTPTLLRILTENSFA